MGKKYEYSTPSPTSSKVTIRPIGSGSTQVKEKSSLPANVKKHLK